MKRIVYLMFWFSTTLFFSCEEEEAFTFVAKVRMYNNNCEEVPVEGATVKFYLTYEDFLLRENEFFEGTSNAKGEVTITGVLMENTIYWPLVTKGDMSHLRYYPFVVESGIKMQDGIPSMTFIIAPPLGKLFINLKKEDGTPLVVGSNKYLVVYYISEDDFTTDTKLHESQIATSLLFCEYVVTGSQAKPYDSYQLQDQYGWLPDEFVVGSSVWFRIVAYDGLVGIDNALEMKKYLTTSISKVTLSTNPDVVNSFDVFVTQ